MAKAYKKGEDYRLFYRASGTWAAPTFAEIKAIGDLSVDYAPGDVEVPERGLSTGHLHGDGDAVINFTLFEDTGDANVTALIAAIHSGAMVHLAVCRGNGTPGYEMECVLIGAPFSANRGELVQWEVEAKRHANSDNDFERRTSITIP